MKKVQEYKNGQILNQQELTPAKFVAELMQIIQSVEIPAPMVNSDEFRKQHSHDVLKTLRKSIMNNYNDKKYKFFKDYEVQSPRNQMLLWGAMFSALKEILIDESLEPKTRHLNTISIEEYNQMPKRYRSALKKISIIPDAYVHESAPKSEKYNVILNYGSSDIFDNTCKQIKKLLSVVYKPISEGRMEWNSKDVYGTYVGWKAVAPETSLIKKHFVSDEQMAAITALCTIFRKIAKSCVVTETKHGAKAILEEYTNAKKRENIVLNAHQYVKDMNECAKKTAQFKTEDITERHKNVKRDVLISLYKNIHTYTK